jgi:hypothetical protein
MHLVQLIGIALVLTVAGPPCFAAEDASSNAPDLDIGTLVSEGKDLTTQAKTTDDTLKQLGNEDRKIQVDKADLTKDQSDYIKTSRTFLERCGDQFVQGQESKVASCKTEHEQDLQVFKRVQDKKSELQKEENDWKARKAKADEQKANLAWKLESWKHRMKAALVAKGMNDCSNSVAATAGTGGSYAETLRLVNGYQRCWDGAQSAGALQPSDMNGTPVFSLNPARTPEQAIEDYRNSGKPDPGASQKKGIDKTTVPPPPPQ